jgi:hypothetical protein
MRGDRETRCEGDRKSFRNEGHCNTDTIDDEHWDVDPFWIRFPQPGGPIIVSVRNGGATKGGGLPENDHQNNDKKNQPHNHQDKPQYFSL